MGNNILVKQPSFVITPPSPPANNTRASKTEIKHIAPFDTANPGNPHKYIIDGIQYSSKNPFAKAIIDERLSAGRIGGADMNIRHVEASFAESMQNSLLGQPEQVAHGLPIGNDQTSKAGKLAGLIRENIDNQQITAVGEWKPDPDLSYAEQLMQCAIWESTFGTNPVNGTPKSFNELLQNDDHEQIRLVLDGLSPLCSGMREVLVRELLEQYRETSDPAAKKIIGQAMSKRVGVEYELIVKETNEKVTVHSLSTNLENEVRFALGEFPHLSTVESRTPLQPTFRRQLLKAAQTEEIQQVVQKKASGFRKIFHIPPERSETVTEVLDSNDPGRMRKYLGKLPAEATARREAVLHRLAVQYRNKLHSRQLPGRSLYCLAVELGFYDNMNATTLGKNPAISGELRMNILSLVMNAGTGFSEQRVNFLIQLLHHQIDNCLTKENAGTFLQLAKQMIVKFSKMEKETVFGNRKENRKELLRMIDVFQCKADTPQSEKVAIFNFYNSEGKDEYARKHYAKERKNSETQGLLNKIQSNLLSRPETAAISPDSATE